jgi:hypothetical protein
MGQFGSPMALQAVTVTLSFEILSNIVRIPFKLISGSLKKSLDSSTI